MYFSGERKCALSIGSLSSRGLPRNIVARLTDRPDMTLAIDRGRIALTQPIHSVTESDTDWAQDISALEYLHRDLDPAGSQSLLHFESPDNHYSVRTLEILPRKRKQHKCCKQ